MPVPDTSRVKTDLQEVSARNNSARQVIAGFSSDIPTMAEIWNHLQLALSDVPILSTEIAQLRAELDETRLDRANLLAAARAAIAAHYEGEPNPLSYLRDELAARGQLPPNSGRLA
jgi:hypothetical protein